MNAEFFTSFSAKSDTVIRVVTHSKGMVCINNVRYSVNTDIHLTAGDYEIRVSLFSPDAFPSLFIDSEYLITDERWSCSFADHHPKALGCEPIFSSTEDNPAVFPFSYLSLKPVEKRAMNGGILYDFGKEYFGSVTVAAVADNDDIDVIYGESEQEALDPVYAIVRKSVRDAKRREEIVLPSAAFRYLFVKTKSGSNPKLSAEYEYLPLSDKAKFSCDSETVEKIWDMCTHTFHLNSREAYLDGIKRDRWVWAGDAYQSFLINRCLYDDRAIVRRTILSLLGHPPYTQHINGINDYSMFLILSVYEYYITSLDSAFVKNIWSKVKALYQFIISRLRDDGYMIELPDDWVFIDWAEFDKTGAFCPEQILLWQVYRAMAQLCLVAGESDIYTARAEQLRQNIMRDFWREEKGAFIDSFESGNEHITRHANIFAIIYDFAETEKVKMIAENVLFDDKIAPIHTPYFKLYELIAFCKLGDIIRAQAYIEEYWGGMLSLGATTVWEEFDPTMQGEKHLEMYGGKFEKSLCHAWGSGPIYLFARYIAGVQITEPGGKCFEVSPNRGSYRHFCATVPMRNGVVRVKYENGCYKICATVDGGTAIVGQERRKLIPNEVVVMRGGEVSHIG